MKGHKNVSMQQCGGEAVKVNRLLAGQGCPTQRMRTACLVLLLKDTLLGHEQSSAVAHIYNSCKKVLGTRHHVARKNDMCKLNHTK